MTCYARREEVGGGEALSFTVLFSTGTRYAHTTSKSVTVNHDDDDNCYTLMSEWADYGAVQA